MKTKTNSYDLWGEFRDDPEAQESVIKMYRKSEQPRARLAADVILKKKFRPAEFAAQRTIKIANLLDKVQADFSKKFKKRSDPNFLIDVPLFTGGDARIDDIGHYSTCWANVLLSWTNPDFIALEKDTGGLNFMFYDGLPPGSYAVWLAWSTLVQKEVKIACVGHANPSLAINPNTEVVKSTEPSTEYFFSGVDMFWEVTQANKRIILCLMNRSGENVICRGASLIGCY